MSDINQVVLVGRLTRDAELKYTNGGAAICKFSLAINRRKKNGDEWVDEANFFDITAFGKQGESLTPYLLKGKQVAVNGELKQERWEQDGQSRSKVGVIANNIQLLGGGQSSTDVEQSQQSPQPQTQQTSQSSPVEIDDFDDEIPF